MFTPKQGMYEKINALQFCPRQNTTEQLDAVLLSARSRTFR